MSNYIGQSDGRLHLHHLGCGMCCAQQAITDPAGNRLGSPFVTLGDFALTDFTGQVSEGAQAIDTVARVIDGKSLSQQTSWEQWWNQNWGWFVAGGALLWASTVGIQAIPQWMTALRRG